MYLRVLRGAVLHELYSPEYERRLVPIRRNYFESSVLEMPRTPLQTSGSWIHRYPVISVFMGFSSSGKVVPGHSTLDQHPLKAESINDASSTSVKAHSSQMQLQRAPIVPSRFWSTSSHGQKPLDYDAQPFSLSRCPLRGPFLPHPRHLGAEEKQEKCVWSNEVPWDGANLNWPMRERCRETRSQVHDQRLCAH